MDYPPVRRFKIEVDVYHMESGADSKKVLLMAFAPLSAQGMIEIKEVREVDKSGNA